MFKSISSKIKELYHQSSSNNFLQPIIVNIELKGQRPYQIVQQEAQVIVKPNFSNIKIDNQCNKKIQEHLKKRKFTQQGVLLGYDSLNNLQRLHIFSGVNQEDLTSLIQNQQCLCIGIWIVKEPNNKTQNQKDFMKKIKNQLKFCMEYKSGVGSNRQAQKYSKLSEIAKLSCKSTRIFLIFQRKQSNTVLHTIRFYPNVTFGLRQIKLKPQKVKQGQVLDRITHFKYPKNSYGYLTQDSKGGFIFQDKANPKIHTIILVGVWIFGQQAISKNQKDKEQIIEKRNKLFWRVIVEYLRKPKIKRGSTLQKNTGVLAYFEKKGQSLHRKLYLFNLNGYQSQNKWDLSYSSEYITQVPNQIDFNKKTLIKQSDDQDIEQAQFISKKQIKKQSLIFVNQNNSNSQISKGNVNTYNTNNSALSPQNIRFNMRDREMYTKSAPRQRLQMENQFNNMNFYQQPSSPLTNHNFYRTHQANNLNNDSNNLNNMSINTNPSMTNTLNNNSKQFYNESERFIQNMSGQNHMTSTRVNHINIHQKEIDIASLRQPSQCRSYQSQSVDQKDVQIALLKKDLQMYKTKYEELKRIHDPMFNCFMKMVSSGVFQNGNFMVPGMGNQFDFMSNFGFSSNNNQMQQSQQISQDCYNLNSLNSQNPMMMMKKESPSRYNQSKKQQESQQNMLVDKNPQAQNSSNINQRRQFVKDINKSEIENDKHQFSGNQQITFANQNSQSQKEDIDEYFKKPATRNFLKKNYSQRQQQLTPPENLNKQHSLPNKNLNQYKLPMPNNSIDSSDQNQNNEAEMQNQDFKNISFGDSHSTSRFKESFGKNQYLKQIYNQHQNMLESSIKDQTTKRIDTASKQKKDQKKLQLQQQAPLFNQSPQFKLASFNSSQKKEKSNFGEQYKNKLDIKVNNLENLSDKKEFKLSKKQFSSEEQNFNQKNKNKYQLQNKQRSFEKQKEKLKEIGSPKQKVINISKKQTYQKYGLISSSDEQDDYQVQKTHHAKKQKQNIQIVRNNKGDSSSDSDSDHKQIIKNLTKRYQVSSNKVK